MGADNFSIIKLERTSINEILFLQDQAISNGVDIMPSSREFYERSFQFKNFVFGLKDFRNDLLLGYCNCSIPTRLSAKNLGRNSLPEKELDNVGHINTIVVDIKYRNRGYGKQIINQVLSEFKAQKICHIYTMVSPRNIASLKLFNHFNFSIIETISYNERERNVLNLYMNLYEN